MTECTSNEIRFRAPGWREIVARFDGGDITSDGGALLLAEVERRTGVLGRFAACFTDHRRPERIEHSVLELVSQRVIGLALGYEDLNDHDELRIDPLLAEVVGKSDPKGVGRKRLRDRGRALSGSRTLNRLELSTPDEAAEHRYKRIPLDTDAVDDVLVDAFVAAYDEPPEEIVLDLDATDDPLHGKQEGRFFNAYYNCYCYLPLYIFCGEHLLCARLRRSNKDGALGSVEELNRIVPRIRASWPEARIVIRGDSGFWREWLMSWCEAQERVEYVLGVARNERLEARVSSDLAAAKDVFEATDEPCRFFSSFEWTTLSSWSRRRRVIAKSEHLRKGPNPRFLVTSLGEEHNARWVYEQLYCARGDMENRIKEQQLYLFADRTSAHTMRANQTRLYFSSIAYVLIQALRRIALAGTEMARAQCHTIRLRLFKIGARVKVTARRIWVHMASSCPYSELFLLAWRRLRVA